MEKSVLRVFLFFRCFRHFGFRLGGYFGLGGRLSGRSNILHFFSFRSLLGGFSRRFFVFSLVRYFLSRV